MSDCPVRIDGFGFTPEEISACMERKGLLSMEIECSLTCNFRCPYCYAGNDETKPSLSYEKICDVILQAKALGARRIIILGGEPMLYPQLREVIDYLRSLEMEVELFTNGTGMTPEAASYMFSRAVTVVLKLNTLKPELQNRLTGVERGNEIIHQALANLKQAGYPTAGNPLAISTVICNDNFEELPELWRWIRSQNMLPYVEMITPQGGAKKNEQWLTVSSDRVKALFDTLARIDREEFGRNWEPQPPLVGNVCKRHQFSCVVTASGAVLPCVGVTIPLGNIHHESLREIIHQSEVLENLRNYRQKIKEPCRSCAKAEGCYGCRGAAFQLTGDYLAPDPLCWNATEAQYDVLPVGTANLVPHGPSIRMVDHLAEVGEREASTTVTVQRDWALVDANGRLDEGAYVEMIAQSLAACQGFHLAADEQKLHRGLLLGIKDMTVSGESRIGDCLHIHVRKLVRYGDFGVAEGTIRHADGREIARGQIKIWQSNNDPAEVMAI